MGQEKRMRGLRPTGPSFLDALGARRRLLARLVVTALAVWAAGTLLLGDQGVLRLHALREQERAMNRRNEALRHQLKETRYELSEAPGMTMERVMRERYRQAFPNEIVYQQKDAPPDSVPAALPGGRPDLEEMGH